MSIAKFIFDFLVYNDSSSTNDPQQRVFDFKKQVDVSALTNATVITPTLTAETTNTINLPNSSIDWVFIVTDQTVNLRFNGDDADVVAVSPSASGTQDGVFLKRGAVTGLVVNVPGATVPNIVIFLGNE